MFFFFVPGEQSGAIFISLALITGINNWAKRLPEAFRYTLRSNSPVVTLISITIAYLSSETLHGANYKC